MSNAPAGFPPGFPDKIPGTTTPEDIAGDMDFFMDWVAPTKKWASFADWGMVAPYEQSLLVFAGFDSWTLNAGSDEVVVPAVSKIVSPLSGGAITVNAGTISGVVDGSKLYINDVSFPMSSNTTKAVSVGSLTYRESRRPDCIFIGVRVGSTLYMRPSSVAAAEPSMKVFEAVLSVSQDITAGSVVNLVPSLYDSDAYTYDSVNDDVTILVTGKYLLSYSVLGTSSGAVPSDTEFDACLRKDSGSGFSAISGSYVFSNLDQAYKSATASMTRILALNAGDKVHVYAKRSSGAMTMHASNAGTAMTITRVQ